MKIVVEVHAEKYDYYILEISIQKFFEKFLTGVAGIMTRINYFFALESKKPTFVKGSRVGYTSQVFFFLPHVDFIQQN